MADDRMKDDLQKNMGTGDKGQNMGQQAPGRTEQRDQQTGQHPGNQQGQQEPRNIDSGNDDSRAGRTGNPNQ